MIQETYIKFEYPLSSNALAKDFFVLVCQLESILMKNILIEVSNMQTLRVTDNTELFIECFYIEVWHMIIKR